MVDVAYGELTQYYPRPGLGGARPGEIWDVVRATLAEVAGRLADHGRAARAIGITNQRETVVAWDRRTGDPLHRAIVWQDRRTAPVCAATGRGRPSPADQGAHRPRPRPVLLGHQDAVAARRGRPLPRRPACAFGTVDSWVLWNLTGGVDGGVVATDATNASRTMLFDIVVRRWSAELCDLFGVPAGSLPEVRPSCGRLGRVADTALGGDSPLRGVPISGMAGDQHAALFGQACFDPGMTKATIRDGELRPDERRPGCAEPVDGLITTLAWDLGTDGDVAIGADGGSTGTGGRRRWPTPSRARCSSRERACSGCGTAWG